MNYGGRAKPRRSVGGRARWSEVRYSEWMRSAWPVFASVLAMSCSAPSEDEVQAEFQAVVERSSRCESSEQCVLLATKCPLGCLHAVRADRAAEVGEKARELIEDYESGGRSCDYQCLAPGTAICEQGRCMESSAPSNPPNGSRACTLIGCGSAFSVQFDKAGAWRQGHYRVLVTLDDRPIECTADFPLSCDVTSSCADPGVLLLLSGCALARESQTIAGVEVLQETPAAVSIEVFDEAGSLVKGAWQPAYLTSTPNGSECEPTCRTAPSEALSIPSRPAG